MKSFDDNPSILTFLYVQIDRCLIERGDLIMYMCLLHPGREFMPQGKYTKWNNRFPSPSTYAYKRSYGCEGPRILATISTS